MTTTWAVRADRLLEQAHDELSSGLDAIPTVTAVLAVLRIECGELPPDGMDGYPFLDEGVDDPAGLCTCPAGLVARGGWRSTCPAHGMEAGAA